MTFGSAVERHVCCSKAGKSLTGKTGQFAFLKRLHYLGAAADDNNTETKSDTDFFNSVKTDLAARKIIILDLPSISSNLLTPLSDKVASDLFNRAQENFLISSVTENDKEGNTSTPVLMYVEEAHNVLSDNQNTIFPRIAREGRKYGIGLVYSTQRPGSIAIPSPKLTRL